MRLATVFVRRKGIEMWGVWGNEAFYPVESKEYPTLLSFIEDERRPLQLLSMSKQGIPHEEVEVKAPFYPKKNIYCVGKNYHDHVREMGTFTGSGETPAWPLFFTKASGTVIGPTDEIDPHEGVTEALDYEGELAVIVGKRGKNIPEEEAPSYIFGYSIINDVTARDLQKRHQQFFKGKSLDTFAPFGPFLLMKESQDQEPFHLYTYVNGELRQEGSTDQLIFSIPKLVHILSQGLTLEPGDIIATGTPSGVGQGFTPPRYLHPGDLVEVVIDPIGRLQNRVGKSL